MKTEIIAIKLTKEEKILIEEKARQEHLAPSVMIRKMILDMLEQIPRLSSPKNPPKIFFKKSP